MVSRRAPNPSHLRVRGLNWTGVQQHVYNLCNFLVQNGHIVDVYCVAGILGKTLPFQIQSAPLLRAERPITEFQISVRQVLLSFYLSTIVHRYDLAHAHAPLSAVGLTVLRPAPLIVTFHSVGLAKARSQPHRTIRQLLMKDSGFYAAERMSAEGADRIIAVSKSVEKELTTLYRVPRGKITVIPNGIDSSKFKLLNKKECRVRLGIEEAAGVILFVGRLDAMKGVHVLLDAFKRLDRPSVQLHIVGKGPLATTVTKFASSDARVNYHDFVEPTSQLKQILVSAADVFVSPSFYEGGAPPYVVLEMMASKKPLVLSDIPAHREGASGRAYFFEPGNSESLARSLEHALSEDLTPREDLSSWVDTAYSLETQNRMTMEVYEEVARG